MNKNVKQTKAAKAKAEEEALNHILSWIVSGSVLEFLVMLLNRYWSHYGPKTLQLRLVLDKVVPVLAFVALAGAVALGLWWNKTRKAGRNTDLSGGLCFIVGGISLACFAAWLLGEVGLIFLTLLVPATVVLALIYYLYQREFFFIACQSTLALLGIWLCDRGLHSMRAVYCYLYVAGAAVILLAGMALCRKLQAGSGSVEWKETKLHLLSKTANYALLYVGALVGVGTLVCAVAGLPAMILYGVSVAWVLVMAVYYTVKLM